MATTDNEMTHRNVLGGPTGETIGEYESETAAWQAAREQADASHRPVVTYRIRHGRVLAGQEGVWTDPAIARDLNALRAALIDDARRAHEAEANGRTYSAIDWTRLPTFGGAEPRNTAGVWSWDATRLLVGTSAADLRIVAREE